MEGDRLAGITEAQRACLRMVLRHMSSKHIARALAISPHTVDQRIRLAMKTLGAANRVEAARMLAAAEGEGDYQGLIHQSPDIDPPPDSPPAAARPGDDEEVRSGGRLPRFVWVMVAAAAAALAFAGLFIGLNAVSEFTR